MRRHDPEDDDVGRISQDEHGGDHDLQKSQVLCAHGIQERTSAAEGHDKQPDLPGLGVEVEVPNYDRFLRHLSRDVHAACDTADPRECEQPASNIADELLGFGVREFGRPMILPSRGGCSVESLDV